MRNKREHDFIFTMLGGGLAEQMTQNRNLRKPWNPSQGFRRAVFQHSAQQIDLALLKANLVLNFSLANDGLTDAADVRLSGDVRNVHRDLQGHFAAGVNLGRDIDVHANIQVLELCVNQWIDADSTNTRLK